MLRIAYSAVVLSLALTLGAPATAASAAQKKAPAKAAAPAQPIAHVVDYAELEHHVGDTVVVETTFDTVRRGKLVKYTNPGITLQLGPENGSIELDIPRETVRNVSLVAADPAPAKAEQETGSAKKN